MMKKHTETNNELLIRIDERLNILIATVKELESKPQVSVSDFQNIVKKVSKHDTEIEKIKTWKTSVLGIASGVSLVVGFLTALFMSQIKAMMGIK